MNEPSSSGIALAAAIRAASVDDVEAVLAPEALVDFGNSTLADALNALKADQRAGVTLIGDADRSIIVAPSSLDRPASSLVVVATHPGSGSVIELLGYGEERGDADAIGVYPPFIPIPAPLPESTTPDVDVSAERVLVMGSSDGLGRSIAQAFLDAGAAVVLHGTRPRSEVREPIPANVHYVRADLNGDDSAENVVDDAVRLLGGPISILVHAVGPWDATAVTSAPLFAWHHAMDAHVRSVVKLANLIAPGMRMAGRGRIILISAGSAWVRDHGLYGFTKAITEPLVETLAIELAPEVTVNAIAPGQIHESAATIEKYETGAASRMLRRTPTGRFVTRDELAGAVLALTRSPFDSVNGVVLPLDGGARIPTDRVAQ